MGPMPSCRGHNYSAAPAEVHVLSVSVQRTAVLYAAMHNPHEIEGFRSDTRRGGLTRVGAASRSWGNCGQFNARRGPACGVARCPVDRTCRSRSIRPATPRGAMFKRSDWGALGICGACSRIPIFFDRAARRRTILAHKGDGGRRAYAIEHLPPPSTRRPRGAYPADWFRRSARPSETRPDRVRPWDKADVPVAAPGLAATLLVPRNRSSAGPCTRDCFSD